MISAVIPVFNEEQSLARLHQELDDTCRTYGYKLQVIFVDDGSTDGSWRAIESLARRDTRVQGIRFRRNFGKAAALSAGFAAVEGDLVVTLDADLQDDPGEIPRFLEKIESGLDVVSGWKKVRHDPWHKVLPSRVFNNLVSWTTGVRLHDHNCGFKCYRREVVQEVNLYGEMHRFVPVLAAARGFRVGEIVVEHRPRSFGRSKYGVERLIKGFLDLLTVKFLTGFGQRPLHLLGTIGMVCFLMGSIGLTLLAGVWVYSRLLWEAADHVHLHTRPALYYSLGLFLLGGQFMSVGFLGELITSRMGRASDVYVVAQQVGGREGPHPPADRDKPPSAEVA